MEWIDDPMMYEISALDDLGIVDTDDPFDGNLRPDSIWPSFNGRRPPLQHVQADDPIPTTYWSTNDIVVSSFAGVRALRSMRNRGFSESHIELHNEFWEQHGADGFQGESDLSAWLTYIKSSRSILLGDARMRRSTLRVLTCPDLFALLASFLHEDDFESDGEEATLADEDAPDGTTVRCFKFIMRPNPRNGLSRLVIAQDDEVSTPGNSVSDLESEILMGEPAGSPSASSDSHFVE